MSEMNRVQRWRQQQRAAGKKPLTIWVTDEEKLRLKHMLAQWQGESLPVTDTVTDTEQLRVVTDTVADTIRQELPLLVRLAVEELQLQSALPVTDTVTDTILQGVTDTVTAMKTSPLAHAGNIDVTATVTDTQSIVTFTVTDTEEAIEAAGVTATGTDTSQVPGADYRKWTAPEHATDTVTDTVTDTHSYPVPEGAMDHQGEYVTDTVTDTHVQSQDVTAAALEAPLVTDTDTVTDTAPAPTAKRKVPVRQRAVTVPVADTVTDTEAKHRGRKPVLRPGILALLDEHPDGLTAAELKVHLGTAKPIGDTLAGMVKAALLVKTGSGHAIRYQLAEATPL